MTEQTPALTTSDVRPAALKASDPLAMLIGGVFLAASAAGLVRMSGLSGEDVANLQAGILMVAAVIRFWLESRNAKAVVAKSSALEAKAHRAGLLKPVPVDRHGRPEGGKLEISPGELELDETPVEGIDATRGASGAMLSGLAFALLALSLAAACSPVTMATVRPGLGAIVSSVDVRRLVECGSHLPDYQAAARCLGAEAATQGVRVALDRAHALAERALEASGPKGADDMSDDDRDALAAELDEALDALAVEIDATHGPE